MSLIKRCFILAVIVVGLALASCAKNVSLYKEALKSYRNGDFESSLQTNVQSLQLKPTYLKAQDLIRKTYSTAVAGREYRISKIEEAAQPNMYDILVTEYQSLVDLQNLVRTVNPLIHPKTGQPYYFDFQDFETKLAQTKVNAAETHYQRGLVLSENINPDYQREAALAFKAALSYIPNYADATTRYEQARRNAIKRIAILTFEDKSGARAKYGSLIDLLTDSIISRLVMDKSVEEFVEIVTRDQLNVLAQEQMLNPGVDLNESDSTLLSNVLGVHEVMTGKIVQINYVPPRVTSIDFKETKNIVIGTEKYIDDKGKERTREIKGDVTCTYRRFTKTATVKVIASFSLIEVMSGRVKLQDTVNAEFPWTDYWGRIISGDERALSDATLALCSKDEPFPPSEVDMVNYAMNLLSGEIVSRVKFYLIRL